MKYKYIYIYIYIFIYWRIKFIVRTLKPKAIFGKVMANDASKSNGVRNTVGSTGFPLGARAHGPSFTGIFIYS